MKKITYFILTLNLFLLTSCIKKDSNPNSSVKILIQKDAPVILIGEVSSLTGSEATFGQSTRDGIQLALEQVNAQNGINGKKIKVIVLDNQSKDEETATAITRLITQDHVAAVLGEVASSRSRIMAPIAQSNAVPMISPSSTNPKVTQVGSYIFRSCFIDSFQGAVMARFAIETLHAKTAAVFRDIKNDYSLGLSDHFSKKFKELGGSIVIDQSYSAGDVDFKSQLTAIHAKKPDVIFVPGYYTQVGLIARQAKEVGIEVPLLGGDGWDSSKLLEIAGKALNGSYFSNHYSPEDKDPKVQKFIAEYKTRFQQVPDSMAAMGYDAMMMLVEAVRRAFDRSTDGSVTNEDLRNAIAQTKNFNGVTGNMSLDANRDAIKSATILKIVDQKFTFQQIIHPAE